MQPFGIGLRQNHGLRDCWAKAIKVEEGKVLELVHNDLF